LGEGWKKLDVSIKKYLHNFIEISFYSETFLRIFDTYFESFFYKENQDKLNHGTDGAEL